MLRFLTDEDFDATIVRGLLRRLPELDVLSVRDIGLSGATDPAVLERAARDERVLLTHDVNTMVGHADERIRRGGHHAGLVKVPQALPVRRAIEELEYLAQVAEPADLKDRTLHLPL